MDGKQVTVFGGAGFLGRNIVQQLARRGARITVGCRDVERAKFLKTMGTIGQITPIKAEVTNVGQLAEAIEGSDMVVSLVGILYETGRNSFDSVQATAPGLIAKTAVEANVDSLVHISAIGADKESSSVYARSKALGEESVLNNCPYATILRPSIIVGPNDSFFNKFAGLANIAPALPLIGGGNTKFQPVYVQDIALASVAALELQEVRGKIFELGGPSIYTFQELLQLMMVYTRRPRPLIKIPFWIADIKARFLEMLPRPLLTRDQVQLLKKDNVVADDALGLEDLGITATAIEVILPNYLDRFRPGGRFNRFRVTE